MVTENLKSKVIEAIKERRRLFESSDAKYATSMGLSATAYSRLIKGQTDRVISDQTWITLARKLEVSAGDAPEWKIANTPVYQFITAQLEACQQNSMSALLCDLSDIGKTFTAKVYCKTHRNAIYIDCSQVKSRQKLIRCIASGFGLGSAGKYADVYADLVYYIKTMVTPLIILDEAGDLSYEAFLEVKALWNATELSCGYYMMGADGLREKIKRAINCKKVGYAEVFSRFGKRYGSIIPENENGARELLTSSARMIIKANNHSDADCGTVLRNTLGDDNMPSLRRIYKELAKAQ